MERRIVVNETNEHFDGGMKQMWVGIKGILGKPLGQADIVHTGRNIWTCSYT